MEFKTPLVLLLLPLVLGGLWYLRRRHRQGAFVFPSLKLLAPVLTWKTKFSFIPFCLRLLAIVLICMALAGPRKVLEQSKVVTEGIDIVLALDCSGSMAAEDFKINGRRWNRFEIVKTAVSEFIEQRKSDQLALVAFSGRAYTVCPLTTDHRWLLENLQRMRLGLIEDGTAVGSGIATSLVRLKNSKAKSRIIVILTDGVNNTGSIEPVAAARMAASLGVKIYTIGVGAKGMAPFPVQDMFGRVFYQNVQSDLDEDTLKKIAEITHGQYFRATDTESLREIYKVIDRLETSKIEHKGYKEYQELFGAFAAAALIFLALELFLSNGIFFKIP